MERFYSNGKLLLSGEYVVLDGANALAVPTKFGQDLRIEKIDAPQLIWGSFDAQDRCWFEASFDLPKLRLHSATFNSAQEGSAEFIAETLQNILQEARKLHPSFLNTDTGYVVQTKLSFPRNWGLGSSSTLINNIASWANVDPFTLLWNAFSGSGYDIACAKHDSPITYRLENSTPKIATVDFSPSYKDALYFIHLNQKQDSREGIRLYKKNRKEAQSLIPSINNLTQEFLQAKTIEEVNKILVEHERIISSIIQQKTVQERLFSDYFGAIKSLGAWGGDFILATGNEDTPKYFASKGYHTIVPYEEMVLS